LTEGKAGAPERSLITPEKDSAYQFDDGAAYERFMGRWSRGAGKVFLDWIAPTPGACWLDVGCGTGSFTELIVDMCSPASVSAIDPEQAQINHARNGPVANRARFEVGDAEVLPFADGTFDVVVSGLVLNFIPDPVQALSEMLRVTRRGGTIGGYVWDFAADLSPTWPMRRGLRQLGASIAPTPGDENTGLTALSALFERAGLQGVVTNSVDVTMRFADFDDFWTTQTPSFNPIAKMISKLEISRRTRLIEAVRAEVVRPDGTVEYSARANAVSGRTSG
jgi:ubiquinone/menaquinone biosynthesis C-methylase UbiE